MPLSCGILSTGTFGTRGAETGSDCVPTGSGGAETGSEGAETGSKGAETGSEGVHTVSGGAERGSVLKTFVHKVLQYLVSSLGPTY